MKELVDLKVCPAEAAEEEWEHLEVIENQDLEVGLTHLEVAMDFNYGI